jgi:hypothetical protein
MSKNNMQVNINSLDILGGRKRRSSNSKIGPPPYKAEVKLPHLKTHLKLVSKDKENLKTKNQLKTPNSPSENINVGNMVSLNFMMHNDEECVNSYQSLVNQQNQ